jgi:hypothetical protein
VGDFSTLTVAGASGDAYDPDVDIQTHAAATINVALGQSATVPLSANALARWHSTQFWLQTTPTGVRYTFLMATLVNDSGGDHSTLVINYTLGANDAAGTTRVEETPGHTVYYSLDGTTWTRIPALNSAVPPGDIGPKSGEVALSSPWLAGTTMYVAWLDDNATPDRNNAGNEEGGYTIDNLQFLFNVVAPEITGDPAPTTMVNERGTLTLSVVQSGGTTIKWFKGVTELANGTSCVDGHDRTIAGATSSTLTITGVTPGDAGTYHCEVSNTAGTDTSANASVTVNADTTAPTVLYALCGSTPSEFVVVFSEQLNDSCGPIGGGGAVTDISNWSVEDVGGLPLGVVNFTNMTALQNGQTMLGLVTDPMRPHDPTKQVRISWLSSDFTDAAATPNSLPAGSALALCFTSELLASNATWRYNDTGADLGPSWYTGDDSTLPLTGPGIFDGVRAAAPPFCRATHPFGGPVGTCLTYSNATTLTFITNYYFRTHFNYSGNPAQAGLVLDTYIDDGAVIYLNGTELTRVRMPAGPVSNVTFGTINADGSTSNGEYQRFLFPPGTSLQSGNNVLAAEVHQVNAGSSDITWGCRVSSLGSTPPLTVSISHDSIGGTVTVSWSGGSPGTLRSTTSITTPRPWPVVTGAVSPYTTTSTGPQRFYEVSDP